MGPSTNTTWLTHTLVVNSNIQHPVGQILFASLLMFRYLGGLWRLAELLWCHFKVKNSRWYRNNNEASCWRTRPKCAMFRASEPLNLSKRAPTQIPFLRVTKKTMIPLFTCWTQSGGNLWVKLWVPLQRGLDNYMPFSLCSLGLSLRVSLHYFPTKSRVFNFKSLRGSTYSMT